MQIHQMQEREKEVPATVQSSASTKNELKVKVTEDSRKIRCRDDWKKKRLTTITCSFSSSTLNESKSNHDWITYLRNSIILRIWKLCSIEMKKLRPNNHVPRNHSYDHPKPEKLHFHAVSASDSRTSLKRRWWRDKISKKLETLRV